MKVICPKCQFENQADSSRVVCARCATIIEVRIDQGTGQGPGLDGNGKRQTARLPFATNTPSSGSQPLNSQSLNQNRDVYATRVGDDFDDVLDLPRPPQTSYPAATEPSPVFEDVFSASNYDAATSYDFPSYEKKPTTPVDNFQTDTSRQRQTQDYTEPSEPEFMGWPVLPENSIEEDESGSGNRGGLLARLGLIIAVFGVLCAVAYYFLGDFIASRKKQEDNLVSNGAPAQTGAAAASSPLAAPGASVNPSDGKAEVNNNPAASGNSIVPPIITPKSPDASAAGGNRGEEVVVSPLPAGRNAHSQTPKPAQPPVSEVPPAPNKGNLTIQVGSYNDQAQANDRAAKLRSAQIDARVVRADIPGKGTWYRVQIGGFASREEAASYGNQLKSKGAPEFIVTTVGK